MRNHKKIIISKKVNIVIKVKKIQFKNKKINN